LIYSDADAQKLVDQLAALIRKFLGA
jgi:hypothetical protein